jgi:hypothetical protein
MGKFSIWENERCKLFIPRDIHRDITAFRFQQITMCFFPVLIFTNCICIFINFFYRKPVLHPDSSFKYSSHIWIQEAQTIPATLPFFYYTCFFYIQATISKIFPFKISTFYGILLETKTAELIREGGLIYGASRNKNH